MVEFQYILVSICLFLPVLPTSAFEKMFCSNDSLVDLKTKPQGVIVFPSTTANFTTERCQVEVRSPMDSKTELTLVNLRLKHTAEVCFESSVEIFAQFSNNNGSHTFCKSVGSMETLTLKSTMIEMDYTASDGNELKMNRTKDAVSVRYKRIDSTKACRHVLNSKNRQFETTGYPNNPLQGECEWVINTGNLAKEKTVLKFQILNVHYLNCENNFIEIRQGGSIAAPAWKKICSADQSTRIVSSASKLWVRIKSSSTHGIGFQALYETQTCEVVTAYKQLDFNLETGSSCKTWNLTAPHGHIVALSFSQFYLVSEDTTSCSGSVIEIWDGKTKTTYCNSKLPPLIIMSKGRKMVVRYYSEKFFQINSFAASFTSILPSSFKTNCFVHEKELKFKCNNGPIISCALQCDGAMQCSDNSDENMCSEMQARWHKLEMFVIVMGCICASTVIFCVGMVCFRKCFVGERSSSSSRCSRGLSITDQSPLTPNADLPSPPPCYFTDQDEGPPATIIRGTYFFGDEFSQSGIHSASLFGIPPPRYRSTESLHQSSTGARSIWQRSISSIPLASTEGTRNNEIVSLTEEDPPGYDSLPADKDEQIIASPQLPQNSNMTRELETCLTENSESLSSELVSNRNHLGSGMPIELQTHVPSTSFSIECVADHFSSDLDIGVTNTGASLNV